MQTVRRMESALSTEMLPGTEVMLDNQSLQLIKSKDGKSVLVPQPSEDPHDPLVRPFRYFSHWLIWSMSQ